MAIQFVFNIITKPAPKETAPNGNPGWYVVDRGHIVAYTSTEEEAGRVAEDFSRMAERVRSR